MQTDPPTNRRSKPIPYRPESGGDPSIAFITKPKCGSQWIRNVLTDPRIAPGLGIRKLVDLSKIEGENFPFVEPATFYGPCFGTNRRQWQRFRRPADRAVFVSRDPRDMLVSWLHSILFSHVPDEHVEPIRKVLLEIPSGERLLKGMEWVESMQVSIRTFFEEADPGILLTTYEKLATSPDGFLEVLEFLGWSGSEATAREVIEAFSFRSQSGRDPGKEDPFSHFRKGSPGDWRNYFSRSSGHAFEEQMPGLLLSMGYETSTSWWEPLQETPVRKVELPTIDYREYAELRRQNEELQRECERLRSLVARGATSKERAGGWLRRWKR